MSHLQIIEELCGICAAQNEIIQAQSGALHGYDRRVTRL